MSTWSQALDKIANSSISPIWKFLHSSWACRPKLMAMPSMLQWLRNSEEAGQLSEGKPTSWFFCHCSFITQCFIWWQQHDGRWQGWFWGGARLVGIDLIFHYLNLTCFMLSFEYYGSLCSFGSCVNYCAALVIHYLGRIHRTVKSWEQGTNWACTDISSSVLLDTFLWGLWPCTCLCGSVKGRVGLLMEEAAKALPKSLCHRDCLWHLIIWRNEI